MLKTLTINPGPDKETEISASICGCKINVLTKIPDYKSNNK